MFLPRGLEKDWTEFFVGAAECLDGVAVREEGDHLGRVVGARVPSRVPDKMME
jgi:hypothetical protein